MDDGRLNHLKRFKKCEIKSKNGRRVYTKDYQQFSAIHAYCQQIRHHQPTFSVQVLVK
jgi:hypothetical protein